MSVLRSAAADQDERGIAPEADRSGRMMAGAGGGWSGKWAKLGVRFAFSCFLAIWG
jgi:hypothetical protein